MVLKKRKQSAARIGAADELAIADYGADENITDNAKIQWVNQPWVRKLLRAAAMVSFVSLCFNTPKTFETVNGTRYLTLVVDGIVTMLFFTEMIAKMTTRGLIFGDSAYLRDNWGRFDTSMVLSLWVSVLLQVCQLRGIVDEYTPYTILRVPRSFIMIRSFRVYLKFKLPKARVKSIFKRSGQQVYSVTIFLVFFLVLYGMLGVQMFGELDYHCVDGNISDDGDYEYGANDLAIPDTHCNLEREGKANYRQCPDGMVCKKVPLNESLSGYNSFKHIGVSIFTVYESASLEGWVFIMYKVLDSFPSWRGYFFFITMIFFLAWLVKNVFIAVIIETFAEIRVQFRQMWTRSGMAQCFDSKVLQDDGTYTPWKLTVVNENNSRGPAPACCQKVLESRSFHFFILGMVAVDAILASTFNMFYQDDQAKKDLYHYGLKVTQVAFTLLFDLEVLFKVWCLGFRGYFKRSLHKYELCLAIGTTLRIIESLYATQFAYFQVIRCFRLIKLSPTLEDFSRKVFGPFIKLGTLILFTMSSLILVSVISLQLFCYIKDLKQFEDFPTAFMSMFQILTQKGWAIVMYDCMLAANAPFAAVIAIYFITYHLFATVIVLSLFVAVILDNLELQEDFKGLKQMKASEEKSAERLLPLRLRVFQKFPDKPQMITLSKRIPSEFSLPKIRDSFIKQFVETGSDMERLLKRSANRESSGSLALALTPASYACPTSPLYLMSRRLPAFTTQVQGKLQKKTGVNCIVRDSAHQRVLSLGFGAVGYRGRMLSEYGSRDRRLRYSTKYLSPFSYHPSMCTLRRSSSSS